MPFGQTSPPMEYQQSGGILQKLLRPIFRMSAPLQGHDFVLCGEQMKHLSKYYLFSE